MPTRTPSTTSISGNWDTPVYVDIQNPYSFPTTTNVRIEQEPVVDRNSSLQTEVMRQLERAAQSSPWWRIPAPNITPPKKFFGATVCEAVIPALVEMRYLIKDIWYTCVALWWRVPQFHITELDAGYVWNEQLISSNLSRFNDEAIIDDMELEYAKRQFYNIPIQLNGNNQGGSVFQYRNM